MYLVGPIAAVSLSVAFSTERFGSKADFQSTHTSAKGQTRTCLTGGALSAFPPVADIQCGCAVEPFRQTAFLGASARQGKTVVLQGESTELLQRVVARTAEVARSNASERTGVQGFHLVTLHSASPDKALVRAASLKGV